MSVVHGGKRSDGVGLGFVDGGSREEAMKEEDADGVSKQGEACGISAISGIFGIEAWV